jgi:hypothetical protein
MDASDDVAAAVPAAIKKSAETEAHFRLKRLAFTWAQQNGYSARAFEVSLPRCRYRPDVAAYRPSKIDIGTTAIFECKQCLVDLRRDNGCTATTIRRLEKVHKRREVLERNLRIHYPALRVHDSLFAEFDSHNFEAIGHRGYKQVLRQTRALQNRLFDCTKFETLVRYRCANLFFLVLSKDIFREWSKWDGRHGRLRRKGMQSSATGAAEIQSEIPIGWGALIESDGTLELVRKPVWYDVTDQNRLVFLERIARVGTRALNKSFGITFDPVAANS